MLARAGHPLTAGLDRLAIIDERYTRLRLDAGSAVFLEQEEDGERHPIGWTRTWGASAVVVDALGHDAASYGGAGRTGAAGTRARLAARPDRLSGAGGRVSHAPATKW